MNQDELISHIAELERQAIGYFDGEIAHEQAQAMDYYLRKPFGTEEEGRSQVISSDVWDVVEGLTPLVLKPFVSSDDVVSFRPHGPEDEEAAAQETDYINFIVTQRNDNFEQLVAWVKTGLLQKNGVVKWWWDSSKQTSLERVTDVPEDAFAAILQDPSIEVVDHSEEATADGVVLHSATLRISNEAGRPVYEVVPPDEYVIGRDARSVNPAKARFFQHRRRVTISQLREWGYDVADDAPGGDEDDDMSPIRQSREKEEEDRSLSGHGNDPASREVLFKETYIRVDFDGDGLAELRKVCSVGREILANEETEEIPFAAWTPYQQPFKFYGRCPADEAMEVQLSKSAVLRQTMDNIYTINNNRVYAGRGVNLDDLVDNQISGVVRVDSDDVGRVVQPAEVQPIGQITLPLIEYFDTIKENRTGFTRYNQGTDADTLNKTATGIRIIAENAGSRVEIIARAFAETGLRQLMLGIHALCRRHATRQEVVRLRGKYVQVDPRAWQSRFDMTVQVGLGNADKQMKLQGAQMLMAEQKQLAQVPGLVTPVNFYNGAAKLAEAVGFRNAELFFSDPSKQPPAPPPDPTQDPAFQLQMREQDRKDAELQLKAEEVQLKRADLELRDRDSKVQHLRGLVDMQHGQEAVQRDERRNAEKAEGEKGALDAVIQQIQALSDQVAQLTRAVSGQV